MKLVTQDYGCGTSSSILDYGIEDVVIVSPTNYEHVFDVDDDLFFIGHDFLFFLWDTQEKLNRWQSHKHRKAVWCFERIDAIVPSWKEKSEYSLSILKKFVDEVYVCDEDDATKYGNWLPQWGSCVFFDRRNDPITKNKLLFSGQAGRPEYAERTRLLKEIIEDKDLSGSLDIANFTREYSWENYTSNLLSYSAILNPLGILRGFNTRAYEVLYSGRLLLQQTAGKYTKHEELIRGLPNVITFQNLRDMKSKLGDFEYADSQEFYLNNNIFARFKSIGIDIK